MATDNASKKRPPSDHTCTPLAKGVQTCNYGLNFEEYSETLDFLKRVEADLDLRSQVIAQLESEWKPAIATALELFYQRLRCKECNFGPGTSGPNCQLSADSQRRLNDLIQEMKTFFVDKLDLAKFTQFKKRLRSLEKEYLEVNKVAACKGRTSNSVSSG
jgi:hypothetical protein